MRPLLALALLAASAALAADDRPSPRDSKPPLVLKVVLVPESEFTVRQLEARFRKILNEQAGRTEFLRVQAFTEERAISTTIKYGTDFNYDAWLQWYRDYVNAIPPTAELLAIDGNAAMRVRDPSGKVTALSLAGSDPYTLRLAGTEFNLLHLMARDTAPFDPTKFDLWKEGKKGFILTLNFFLVAKSDIDEVIAKTISEKLRVVTGVEQVCVTIRRDAWFISSEEFPIVSPYVKRAEPPSGEEYRNSPEWYCQAVAGRVDCSLSSH